MKRFLKSFVIFGFLLAQGNYGMAPFKNMEVFRHGKAGQFIVDIVTWIMSIIGAVAIGFIVYGAIRYVTSAGNEKQIEEAKKIILYAIIGFVIAILAVVIINIVGRVAAPYPCDKLDGWECISGAWHPEEHPPSECTCVGDKCTGTCCTPPAGYSECKASPDLACGGDFCCGTGTLCCCKK